MRGKRGAGRWIERTWNRRPRRVGVEVEAASRGSADGETRTARGGGTRKGEAAAAPRWGGEARRCVCLCVQVRRGGAFDLEETGGVG